MIDTDSRSRASEILERVKKEKLTNWQLEDQWPNYDPGNTDPSLNCVLRWLWTLYDDGKEAILFDLMSSEDKEILDRCIQFFKTDIEFQVKEVSLEEERQTRRQWGKEWRTDCTSPETNPNWPFQN